MRRLALLALLALPFAASAQSLPFTPSIGLKLGYSQANLPGLAGGIDFKIPTTNFRLDFDGYSAFKEFGKDDAGVSFTANYVKQLPFVYVGAGVGYMNGKYESRSFNSVAGKVFVGGKVPFLGTGLEGSVLFGHHTVATVTAVWRF